MRETIGKRKDRRWNASHPIIMVHGTGISNTNTGTIIIVRNGVLIL